MPARDEVQQIAAALEHPSAGYLQRVQAARTAAATESGEASRQLGLFVDRLADLSTDELQELHQETFLRHKAVIDPLVARLAHGRTSALEADAALAALAPLLDRLEMERNPFAYAVKSLCCVLLRRVGPSHDGQVSSQAVDPVIAQFDSHSNPARKPEGARRPPDPRSWTLQIPINERPIPYPDPIPRCPDAPNSEPPNSRSPPMPRTPERRTPNAEL